MPAKPRWWLQITQILECLETLGTSWLDRSAIERIFGVRRRRAIELLNAFGGFQTGRTFLIERETLIRQLKAIRQGRDFDWERRRRRRRLSEALTEARRENQARQILIPILPPSPALPEGVRVAPGSMIIEYRGVQELLARLYAISQTAARDFAAFQEAVEPASH